MCMSVFTFFLIFGLIHAQEKQLRCQGKILLPAKSRPRAYYAKVIEHDVKNMEIPKTFDARLKWPNCKSIGRIKNQGKCGGCWAFSSTSVIADRICIASNGKYDLDISVQDLMECCINCTSNYGKSLYAGCMEGYPYRAFEWFIENGIVTGGHKGCKPLEESVSNGKYTGRCKEKCTNRAYSIPYNKDKWYGKEWVFLEVPGLTDGAKTIKAELMINGPIVAAFNVCPYMNDLPPGYVIHFNESLVSPDEKTYLHAVKLIGWDITEDGIPVWIFANSWGEDWCDRGFCRIQSTVDALALEVNMMTSVIPILKNENTTQADEKREKTSGSSNNFFRMYGLSILTLVL